MTLSERLNEELEARKLSDAFRSLKLVQGKVDLSSNDYLGFAQDTDLHKTILSEINNLRKFGSTGSRLLTGNHSLTEQLEKEVALFHDAESALFFNSGYEANSGLISTITKRNDTIIFDELCHASLREGIRLSNATSWSFKHNDLTDLELKLQKAEGEKFIVVESVYSMDGDICPLKEIVFFAEKYKANLILDEAHATGVIGNKGEGLAQYLNLHKKVFARVHTCGKAIGNNGAFIFGSATLRDYLINFCRPFIYTTAPNLMQVIAVREAYRKLEQSQDLLIQLQENCSYFKNQIKKHPQIKLLPSDSAIFSVLIPGNADVKLASVYLSNANQDVRPILSPTVKEGEERLRICMHSFNTKLEIDRLIKLLDQFTEFAVREEEQAD
ncbi:MAG: pyridoxal phosphate-dependent aminotransferase family protein [Chitinophagales bacterium]|nr:pyridoxal phosphate-dependent aminotransferase family protein [Chitinophagales bacterium]MBP9796077.1 pyridoxal phosphate-dependent aminotransferase family protein [Chitinophagales bacterium]